MNADVKDVGPARDEKVKAALATSSLEDRILSTLAEAGVGGLGFGDLGDAISHQLEEAVGVDAWEDVDSFDLDPPLAALVKRGVVWEREDKTLTLSYKEWARCLVREAVVPLTEGFTASLSAVIGDRDQIKALEAEFERLLAGGNANEGEDKGVDEDPTFHVPCSIPGCDHEEARPPMSQDPTPSVDSEPWLTVGAQYACRSCGAVAKARGINTWVHPESSCSLGRGYVRPVDIAASDTDRAVLDLAALRVLAREAKSDESTEFVYSDAARGRMFALASAVEQLADAFEWEETFANAILNRAPRDNLISMLKAQRNAARDAGVAEERARRDLTIERLQNERDANHATLMAENERLAAEVGRMKPVVECAERIVDADPQGAPSGLVVFVRAYRQGFEGASPFVDGTTMNPKDLA